MTITPATPRIERLRRQALHTLTHWDHAERTLWHVRGWGELEAFHDPADGMTSMLIRQAKVDAAIIRGLTPVIGPDDLIVGKACMRRLTEEEQAEVDAWRELGRKHTALRAGMNSHMAIDFETLLAIGVEGLQDRIRDLAEPLRLHRPDDVDKALFYRACQISLEAVLDAADGYAALAKGMAESEKESTRKRELEVIAETCARVPRKPAETFR